MDERSSVDARVVTTPMPPSATEFAWNDDDFQRIRALIHRHAGISLHEGKHAMVYSRVSRRLRATGHPSFRAYLDWLEAHPDDDEWQAFVNALTTNLTAFFREPHHFDILRTELCARPEHAWRLWCAAASTGEEPYSMAITCREALGPAGRFEIVASDIDTRVLAAAARGIYRLEHTRGLSPEQLRRHFLRGRGANTGLMRVQPELQRTIRFMRVNLIEELPFREPFDIVFCRNVMIYFDAATQRQVLQRLHRVLRPGGLLFAGHAEHFGDARALFVLRGKTVYERV
jgi:chemotaxis protein methyltransferase CheR